VLSCQHAHHGQRQRGRQRRSDGHTRAFTELPARAIRRHAKGITTWGNQGTHTVPRRLHCSTHGGPQRNAISRVAGQGQAGDFGGQVDIGTQNPRHLAQRPFDAAYTRSASHVFDRQLQLVRGQPVTGLGDRCLRHERHTTCHFFHAPDTRRATYPFDGKQPGGRGWWAVDGALVLDMGRFGAMSRRRQDDRSLLHHTTTPPHHHTTTPPHRHFQRESS